VKERGEGGGSVAESSVEAWSDGGVLCGVGSRSLSGMRRFALSDERKAVVEGLAAVMKVFF